jgi:hypothetical protein
MRWAGPVAQMGTMRNAYNISVGKSEGKRPLRRSRCRWEERVGGYGLEASGSG